MLEAILKVFLRELYILKSQPSQWAQPWIFLCFMAVMPAMLVGDSLKTLPLLNCTFIVLSIVFSSMLTIEKSLVQDNKDGVFAQWILSPWPLWWLMLAKSLSHWILWILPMVLICPIIMVLLGLKLNVAYALFISLIIGTPLLSFVGIMSSALTLNLNSSGFLVALIMLPLIMPMMLLSLSPVQSLLLNQKELASLALLGALTALAVVLCPFGSAVGVKVSQSCGNS